MTREAVTQASAAGRCQRSAGVIFADLSGLLRRNLRPTLMQSSPFGLTFRAPLAGSLEKTRTRALPPWGQCRQRTRRPRSRSCFRVATLLSHDLAHES